jgi:hypothetical protein
MKPSQTPLSKAPSKAEKKEQREDTTKSEPKEQNSNWVTEGHWNKSCLRAPFLKRLSQKRKTKASPHFDKFSETCCEIVQNTGIHLIYLYNILGLSSFPFIRLISL